MDFPFIYRAFFNHTCAEGFSPPFPCLAAQIQHEDYQASLERQRPD
ncbi:hypothetical protein CLOM621_08137 [Clostridium sp. M62/1]|nr:hypothetical protein CLOM621_08137 [Clostridium sp. M62/1]